MDKWFGGDSFNGMNRKEMRVYQISDALMPDIFHFIFW